MLAPACCFTATYCCARGFPLTVRYVLSGRLARQYFKRVHTLLGLTVAACCVRCSWSKATAPCFATGLSRVWHVLLFGVAVGGPFRNILALHVVSVLALGLGASAACGLLHRGFPASCRLGVAGDIESLRRFLVSLVWALSSHSCSGAFSRLRGPCSFGLSLLGRRLRFCVSGLPERVYVVAPSLFGSAVRRRLARFRRPFVLFLFGGVAPLAAGRPFLISRAPLRSFLCLSNS